MLSAFIAVVLLVFAAACLKAAGEIGAGKKYPSNPDSKVAVPGCRLIGALCGVLALCAVRYL